MLNINSLKNLNNSDLKKILMQNNLNNNIMNNNIPNNNNIPT